MVAPWLLLPRILLFLDTLRPREKNGSEGVAAVCSGFCARSLLSCQKTALVSFRTLANFFPLVTDTLSSFNADSSLPTLEHCSCFNSPMPQSFVIEVSDLYSSSPLSSIFDNWHRYILMNLHVVQFQYGFELCGLTYSQFEQTFQDIIGWNL